MPDWKKYWNLLLTASQLIVMLFLSVVEEYGFLKVSEQEYEALDKEYLLRVRKESFGYSCLTNQKNYYLENYPGIIVEKGSVDEVISMLVKGELL